MSRIKFIPGLIILSLILGPQSPLEANDLVASKNRLRPFASDGCSIVPDGLSTDQWLFCCVKHDVAYWVGGSWVDKLHADGELDKCVSSHSMPFLGRIFSDGVRIGGLPELPTSWRWGYGWVRNRGYQERTERDMIIYAQQTEKIVEGFTADKHGASLPISELFCEAASGNLNFQLSNFDKLISHGEGTQGLNSHFALKGFMYSAMVNLTSLLQIVDLKIGNDDNETLILNLIPANDCRLSRTNERLPLTGAILDSSKNSHIYQVLRGQKLCCEMLKNTF